MVTHFEVPLVQYVTMSVVRLLLMVMMAVMVMTVVMVMVIDDECDND